MMRLAWKKSALAVSILLLLTAQASAHPAADSGSAAHDFVAGAVHPFSGVDHLLSMLAVGLLAARLGGRSLWVLPTLFLVGMSSGGVAATLFGSGTIDFIEQAIAASVLVFGLLLAAADRVSPRAASASV